MQFLNWVKSCLIIIFVLLFLLGTIQIYRKYKIECFILCFLEVCVFTVLISLFVLKYYGGVEEVVLIDNKKMIKETHSFLLSNWINYYDYQNIFVRSKQVRIHEEHDDYIGDYIYTIYYDEDGNVIRESKKDNNYESNVNAVSDEDLVKVLEYIPNIIIDLKYATTDNFTNQVIYENKDAYLRYGTVKKLLSVQNELNENGYTLIIWDAYRPISAQFKLWEICPNSKYVSDPNKDYSSHSRGNTVDMTIAKLDGNSVKMPTGFDDFTTKADRNYGDVSEEAKNNAEFLEKIMKKYGFKGYYNEWWHYTDEVQYSVIK